MAKRSWHHLKKYWFKRGKKRRAKSKRSHRRKATHVAKRRKSHGRRRGTHRRRHHTHHRRRRSSRGGGIGPISGHDLMGIGASAVVGFIESKAKGDANFPLNKLPRPVDALGYTGNTALALYAVGYVFRNKWVRLFANATARIAAYQIGRQGKVFDKGDAMFTISGFGDEHLMDEHMMGALAAEGEGVPGEHISGIPWDGGVEEALSHT